MAGRNMRVCGWMTLLLKVAGWERMRKCLTKKRGKKRTFELLDSGTLAKHLKSGQVSGCKMEDSG